MPNVTINDIPVFEARMGDDGTGMLRISIVDAPAVMSDFQAFAEQKRIKLYEVKDEDRHLVRGVVMRCDFPIYRKDAHGEYYLLFKADTIREMAEKYLVENRQNIVNEMHKEDSDVDGVQMVQFFIKGEGVSIEGFDDIADGSLFAEFHVTNEDIWASIKDGTYKGFSLEGLFDIVPETDKAAVEEIVDELDGKFSKTINQKDMKKSGIKAKFVKILQALGAVTTDKGVLGWDGTDDLKVGDSVYMEDTEGNRTPAPDGDYKIEDNKVIVVVDGKVSEIKDDEAEVRTEDMARIATDKGDLLTDSEEDLKEGDEVFVEKDGERVPAEDGDYITEDGKTIRVVDGKVAEIIDDNSEVASELKARKEKFSRRMQAFEASFHEKTDEIFKAISEKVEGEISFYLTDAGDDFGVIEAYDADYNFIGYRRFPISWNEDGSANAGEPVDVKRMFVPVDFESPFDKKEEPEESEEMKKLRKENEQLRKTNEKLSKEPAAKPAHQEVLASENVSQTGNQKLDNLLKILKA